MTDYLFGECAPELARLNTDEGSYAPDFQHVFSGNAEEKFMRVLKKDGGCRYVRLTDMSFMEESGLPCGAVIVDPFGGDVQ